MLLLADRFAGEPTGSQADAHTRGWGGLDSPKFESSAIVPLLAQWLKAIPSLGRRLKGLKQHRDFYISPLTKGKPGRGWRYGGAICHFKEIWSHSCVLSYLYVPLNIILELDTFPGFVLVGFWILMTSSVLKALIFFCCCCCAVIQCVCVWLEKVFWINLAIDTDQKFCFWKVVALLPALGESFKSR